MTAPTPTPDCYDDHGDRRTRVPHTHVPATPDTPAPLNAGEREELARLAEEATPGPWMQGMSGDKMLPEVDNRFHFGMVVLSEFGTDDGDGGISTAAYIAAASPDRILALLAERDALAERVERVRALADAWEASWAGHDAAAPFARALRAALDVSPEPDEGGSDV